jgi:hypothetical protein
MQTSSTFQDAGWDFVEETKNGTANFWYMQEGQYPELSVFAGMIPAEPNGLGTLADPYEIPDANELGSLWYRPYAHYRLEADIDMNDITWSAAVVPYFAGSLYGNGHVLKNLRIQGAGYLGLVGILASNGSLIDVAIEDVDVHGTGDNVGSMVGENFGNITLSSGTGIVHGEHDKVGGLVGINRGNISSSSSTNMVTGNLYSVGGLVGFNFGVITSSSSTGTISGERYVGGLVGFNARNITSSYSMSAVSGDHTIGGLAGFNSVNTLIASCYSTGEVSGNRNVGGLVGDSFDIDDITSSFWDTETSGLNESSGGLGLPTADMQNINTFLDAGWDFVCETENGPNDVWIIPEGDYPRLTWEFEELPPCPCSVE